MKTLKRLLGIITFFTGAYLFITKLFPRLINFLGYHPDYDKKHYNLSGKKALIITTSHDVLGESGAKTGVFSSEFTVPYYEFLDAGMSTDVASISGGVVPFEPMSLKFPLASLADKRYLHDKKAKKKTENSHKIDDVDFTNYDIIFIAGGWGAAYDLGYSQVLGEKLTKANEKGILLGAVCHGALGFIKAKDVNSRPLVEGKNITAVSNRQIRQLSITDTPMHPETELRALGAKYQKNNALFEVLATKVVVDKNIVTGQNQNSAGEAAQDLLRLLARKSS